LTVLLALALNLPAFGQAKTKTRLIFSADTAKPGEILWAGLEMRIPPHWHTYWRNAGDAGLPSTVAWTLPGGVSAGDINWPIPTKTILKAGEIIVCAYSYEDRVVLLVPIKLDPAVKPGSLKLRTALTWLECADQGGCVPGKSELSGKVTVGSKDKPSADAALIERWRARLPQTDAAPSATARWEIVGTNDTRTVIIDWPTTNRAADFYPYENQPSDIEGPTDLLPAPPGHVLLRKTIRKYEGQWPETLVGLLVARTESLNNAGTEARLLLAPPQR
jgi:thiol:disulfide interchange protein DsbD